MSERTDDRKASKPRPRPAPESQPFWEAARAHRLLLPRCNACGKFWFPPSRRCPHCLSSDFVWAETSGRGRIYSFVVFHRAYHPAWEGKVPYTVALIELDEGPVMLSNVIGVDVDDAKLAVGLPVAVAFEAVDESLAIPVFKPAG